MTTPAAAATTANDPPVLETPVAVVVDGQKEGTTASNAQTAPGSPIAISAMLHSVVAGLSPLFSPSKPSTPAKPAESVEQSVPTSPPSKPAFVKEPGEKLHPEYALVPSFDHMFDAGIDGDLFGEIVLDEAAMTTNTTTKFLNEYSKEALFREISTNLTDGLAALGYTKPVLQLDLTDPFVHRTTLSDITLLDEHELEEKARWRPPPLHPKPTRLRPNGTSPIPSSSHLRAPSPSKDSRRRSTSPFLSRRPVFGLDTVAAHPRVVNYIRSRWHAVTSTATLENVPHPKFEVKDHNFLIDVFARRKRMNAHDIKGYQELRQVHDGETTSTATDADGVTTTASVTRAGAPPSPPTSPDRSRRASVSPTTSPRPETADGVSLSPAPYASAPVVRQRRFHLGHREDATRVKSFLDAHFPSHLAVTVIEWTCMQNPKGAWRLDRPPCPGQKYPGLGVARDFSVSLISMASRKGRDALVTVPEHINNAYLYRASGYEFINPAFAGYYEAICDDLKEDLETHGIAAVAWAFHNGHVVDKDGIVEIWSPLELCIPTSSKLRSYFASSEYKRIAADFKQRYTGRLRILWDEATEIHQYSVFWLSEAEEAQKADAEAVDGVKA
ncbi:hypothetical protein HDU96_009224 [Phlyctochytrium bullatum]|nr:hypothetical protein HDU96_009224 [Phlyctochytrium bullatum]